MNIRGTLAVCCAAFLPLLFCAGCVSEPVLIQSPSEDLIFAAAQKKRFQEITAEKKIFLVCADDKESVRTAGEFRKCCAKHGYSLIVTPRPEKTVVSLVRCRFADAGIAVLDAGALSLLDMKPVHSLGKTVLFVPSPAADLMNLLKNIYKAP